MGFLKYLNEMAVNTGINGNSFNREVEWNTIKNSEFTDLLFDNFADYKIYTYGNTYYLTDENIKYLGHIEFEGNSIQSSFSKVKGFYNIMFTAILTQKDYILSGTRLSTQAIKAYTNLSKLPDKKYKISIITPKEIPYDEGVLLEHPLYRVKISEKVVGYMKESIQYYYNKPNTNMSNIYLFNEAIDLKNKNILDYHNFSKLTELIPSNKVPIFWFSPKRAKIGYVDDNDKEVKTDITNIFKEIELEHSTYEQVSDLFVKISDEGEEFRVFWNNKQII